MYHAKGKKKGPFELDEYWWKEEGFTKTELVVLNLLMQVDKNSKERLYPPNKHIVWLDNLFTSIRLL